MNDPVSQEDFRRLEGKVDKLADAIQRLIIIEERQSTQGERIGKCESALAVVEMSLTKTDKKLDSWINRGVGVWAAAALIFTLAQFGAKLFGQINANQIRETKTVHVRFNGGQDRCTAERSEEVCRAERP